MKQYKAVFFDWDGTAVISRKAPVDDVIEPMQKLLKRGIALAVISGTTLENIAGGKLQEYFSKEERQYLYFGLGRGAFNYHFDEHGELLTLAGLIPEQEKLIKIHDICYAIHKKLLKEYQLPTDIVFSRPNYCKIDLMTDSSRGDALFLQEGEKERLLELLENHGFEGGFKSLVTLAEETGKEYGMQVVATTDAKYLEVGISSKSDNVNALLDYMKARQDIQAKDCAFWGDEYLGFDDGLFGSDSFMITEKSRAGDFFDVSDTAGIRPKEVKQVGGGVNSFLNFLKEQNRQ